MSEGSGQKFALPLFAKVRVNTFFLFGVSEFGVGVCTSTV